MQVYDLVRYQAQDRAAAMQLLLLMTGMLFTGKTGESLLYEPDLERSGGFASSKVW